MNIDSDIDEWEDVDDVDDIDMATVDENIIDVATDLLSEEDEDGNDDDEGNIMSNRDSIDMTDDEYTSDDEDEINFSTLTIKDNVSHSIDHYELLISLFELLKKTRAGIKFIRNHNVTNEYAVKHIKLNNQGKMVGGLVLDMSIRWSSTFLMVNRLLIHKDIVKNIFAFPNNFLGLTEKQKQMLYKLALKQNEWDFLIDIQLVLEPFEAATTVLSGQSYPTMAYSFLVWSFLSKFLQATSDDHPIIRALKDCLRFRFNINCYKNLPPRQMELMKVIFLPYISTLFSVKFSNKENRRGFLSSEEFEKCLQIDITIVQCRLPLCATLIMSCITDSLGCFLTSQSFCTRRREWKTSVC